MPFSAVIVASPFFLFLFTFAILFHKMCPLPNAATFRDGFRCNNFADDFKWHTCVQLNERLDMIVKDLTINNSRGTCWRTSTIIVIQPGGVSRIQACHEARGQCLVGHASPRGKRDAGRGVLCHSFRCLGHVRAADYGFASLPLPRLRLGLPRARYTDFCSLDAAARNPGSLFPVLASFGGLRLRLIRPTGLPSRLR